MATKTLTITEEAYNIMKSKKKGNESFSEAIVREWGGHSLWDLVGLLTGKEADELERHVNKMRSQTNERIDEIAEKLK